MFQLLKSKLGMVAVVAVAVVGGGLWVVRGWLLHSVLPEILEKQLTTAMKREISFGEFGLGAGYFSVNDIKIAKGKSLKDGVMVAARQLVIRIKPIQLILHPKNPAAAVKRIELEEPYVSLDMQDFAGDGRKKKRSKAREEPDADAPVPPKTYLRLRSGTVILTRGGVEVMKFARIKGELDLRQFPRVEGNLKFAMPPDSSVAMNGYVHFTLRSFGWSMNLDRLDLARISELASGLNPGMPVKFGGYLTSDIDVRGGFMSMDELLKEITGRGSLKLEEGYVAFRGAPILVEAFLQGNMEDRNITLESLSARMLDGALTASGRLSHLGLGALRVKGRLERVPLKSLRALSPGLPSSLEGETTLEFSMSGTGAKPVVTARLTAPLAGIAGIRLENLTAQAVGSPTDVHVTALRARFWDGTVEGSADAGGWAKGGKMRLRADLAGRTLNMAKSPLGGRYEGQGDLSAKVEGPADRLQGSAKLAITKLKARGARNSDVTLSANMDGTNIRVNMQNASRSVSVQGLLVLGGRDGVRCDGCRMDLQDRIPALMMLGGLEPPKGLDGRGSATVKVEGPLAGPTITLEAFASAVRLGRMALGDQIKVPRVVFKDATLSVPANSPLEVFWGPENTRVRAWGKVPVATFTGKGDQAVAFHLECPGGDIAILKRLDILEEAKGSFTMAADIAGTSAYPIFWSLTLDGGGKLLGTGGQLFAKPMEKWRLKARIADGEGVLDAAEFYVDKQRFGLVRGEKGERANTFVLTGRSLSALDVGFETDWERGLPISIEGVADIRLKARVHAVKEANAEEMMITGPNPAVGAQIELSHGTILFAGGGAGGAQKRNAANGKKGVEVVAEPERPSAFAEWAKRSLNVLGTVSFGKNVRYRPPSLGEKVLSGALFESLKQGLTQGVGGMSALARQALEFEAVIKEGSAIKVGREKGKTTAGGRLALEPGGKIKMRMGITNYEFTLVDEVGLRHEVEFLPGEELAANVSATGEILFRDRPVRTETNASALVEELRIRINVRPPDELRNAEAKRALEADKAFLRYTIKLSSDPEVLTGVVEDVEKTGSGKPITFRPTQGALLIALTGIDRSSAETAATGESGVAGAGKSILKSTGLPFVLDLISKPIKGVLDWVGLRPDVFRLQKSEMMESSSAASAKIPGAGGAAASAGQSQAATNQQFMNDILKNNEVTIGKSITRNLYVNWHVVLLDPTAVTSLLGAKNSTQLAQKTTSSTGQIAELEWRTSQYKAKGRYRFFGLPDDPKQDQPSEGYLGVEMNQPFSGVPQRERFRW